MPKPQSEPNSKLEVDKLDIDKLHLEQDSPKEELIEVTDLLIPPPTIEEEEKATMDKTMEEMMKEEKKYQQEEEKYTLQEKICMVQLSEEAESYTGSKYSGYSYFG